MCKYSAVQEGLLLLWFRGSMVGLEIYHIHKWGGGGPDFSMHSLVFSVMQIGASFLDEIAAGARIQIRTVIEGNSQSHLKFEFHLPQTPK